MTAEELLALADDEHRHELVNGELHTMPFSRAEHGFVACHVGVLIERAPRLRLLCDRAVSVIVFGALPHRLPSGPLEPRVVSFTEDAMLDRTEFARWRESAEDARRSADLQARSHLFNWACFIAEQGAQLAIKGLLHGIGAGAWGHDLVRLGASLAEATDEPAPASIDAALRRLSRHYIPARYPDAHPGGSPGVHYGSEDAEQALLDLGAVLAHVDALWTALSGGAEGADDGS